MTGPGLRSPAAPWPRGALVPFAGGGPRILPRPGYRFPASRDPSDVRR